MNSRKLIGNAIITTAVGIIILRAKKDRLIYLDNLPSFINEYIKTHFASHRILKAVQGRDGFRKTYEVILDGEIEIGFNGRGEVIEIEGGSQLPYSVIPEKISDFISINYPDNVIFEWEIDKRTQEVELDSGLELIFDLDGEFLGIEF